MKRKLRAALTLLTALVLMCAGTIRALAESEDSSGDDVTTNDSSSVSLRLEREDGDTHAGDNVKYNIYLDSNTDTGLNELNFNVNYDEKSLSLYAKNMDGLLVNSDSNTATRDSENGSAYFAFQNDNNTSGTGYIGSVTFSVKDVEAGEYENAVSIAGGGSAYYTDSDGVRHELNVSGSGAALVITTPAPVVINDSGNGGGSGSGGSSNSGDGNNGGGNSGNNGGSYAPQPAVAAVETAAPVLAAAPAAVAAPSSAPTVAATPTLAPSGTVDVPKTGDDARIYVSLLFIAAAVCGLLGVGYFARKRR